MSNEQQFSSMLATLSERRRVLIVEDNPHDLELIASLLAEYKRNDVRAVMNGNTALAALEEIKFDVVFLDLILGSVPEGLEVLKTAVKKARFVIVTGLDSQAPDVLQAVRIGATEFIQKPVTRENIRKALH